MKQGRVILTESNTLPKEVDVDPKERRQACGKK